MVQRIWLDVPYESKDDAKAAGARWDSRARSGYAPAPGMAALAAWAPLPDTLPGEDRSFGSGLFVDLVPQTCWTSNVRSCVVPGDWQRLRMMVSRRAGFRCEACGASRNRDAGRWLEAHERWSYQRLQPSGRLVQRLARLVCLCTPCHQTTHFGHAQVLGQEQDCLEHLCHVNHWSPQQAWEHASDLSRYDEWLSIHRAWRSKPPDTLEKGTVIDSIVEVKGMLNRIKWTIVHYKPPEAMTLNGDGRGGVKVKLMAKVKPKGDGSVVTFDVHLGGPALFGPLGMLVAAALKGDINESLQKFVAVFAPSV